MSERHTPDAAKAIEILTGVLDFYDDGRRWERGYAERDGRRCLMGAILHVSGQQGADVGTDARHYLRAALAPCWPQGLKISDVDLIGYNVESDDYGRVRALILYAIALAQTELLALRVRRRWWASMVRCSRQFGLSIARASRRSAASGRRSCRICRRSRGRSRGPAWYVARVNSDCRSRGLTC
jgi:hypothetical protein